MADAKEEELAAPAERLPWEPITKVAKGTTDPGEDRIPTLVWKHLWTYLKEIITKIFTKSVELG
ncbi:hypothetical protein EYZ11_013511 [Aspergillus tanneri]|uniref:Uncharacterized protein n=1 Tax=Aspergillus tanneri TaxID=1220188 RepID=A0A4V6RQL5_9EURO|nr:hypothetical protein EYZ11_013511 [Aspergillus tanneri]